jgi:hypothetical protein
MVKTALDPGLLVSGPARAPLALAMSSALAAYDNWSTSHPNATRDDALATAQYVINRFQFVDMGNIKRSVEQSRYFGQKAKEQITLDDVGKAEGLLYQDIQRGLLTPQQAESDIKLLGDWRTLLTKQAPPPVIPKTRAGQSAPTVQSPSVAPAQPRSDMQSPPDVTIGQPPILQLGP